MLSKCHRKLQIPFNSPRHQAVLKLTSTEAHRKISFEENVLRFHSEVSRTIRLNIRFKIIEKSTHCYDALSRLLSRNQRFCYEAQLFGCKLNNVCEYTRAVVLFLRNLAIQVSVALFSEFLYICNLVFKSYDVVLISNSSIYIWHSVIRYETHKQKEPKVQ